MLSAGKQRLLLITEIRVAWRSLFSSKAKVRGGMALLAFTLGLAHIAASMLVSLLPSAEPTPQLRVTGYVALDIATLAILAFVISSSMFHALQALFERGSIDIAMASPMSARSLFSSRVLAIAVKSIAPFAVIALPLANMGLVMGHPGLWGLYPMLAILGLLGTAIGVALAMLFVRVNGVQSARRRLFYVNVAMLALFAAAAANWRTRIAPLMETAAADARRAFDFDVLLQPDHWLWLPARAALGWLPGLLLLAAIATFIFQFMVSAMAESYVAGVLESRESRKSKQAKQATSVRDDGRFARFPVAAKELKLIRRSPDLFLQALLQSMALALLLAFFLRRDGGQPLQMQAFALLPSAVVVCLAALTARVAWLISSAEEAPGLLAGCPFDPGSIRTQKMGVAMVLAAPPALLLAAWLATHDVSGAAWMLCMSLMANVSMATIHGWNNNPGQRKDIVHRGKSMPLVIRISESLAIASWGAATYGLPHGTWWGVPTLVTALALPLISCYGGHSRQRGAHAF